MYELHLFPLLSEVSVSKVLPVRGLPLDGQRVIDAARPLSESRLWELNERFFHTAGPSAWAEVPDYVTTSAWNGRVQAELVFAFLEDLWASGALGPQETVTIVELAAGTGRLAHHFLRTLDALLADSTMTSVRVELVLTDLVDANLEVARTHPRFATERDAGRLRCVAWDVDDPEPPVPVDGPLVVLANYLFDGVPSEAYVVADDLYLLHMGLSVPEGADDDDPRLLEQLSVHWDVGEARRDGPYEALLAEYAASVRGAFTVPVAGLELLNRVWGWSARSLVLVADKGVHRLSDVGMDGLPTIALHGSVSMNVNLHALCRWTELQGGAALSCWHDGTGLDTVVLARGVTPLALRRAFGRWEDLDAGTYRTLWGRLGANQGLTVRQAFALLRFAGHEPRALQVVVDALEEAALAGKLPADTLRQALARVHAATYLPGPYDVDFDLGRLRVALGDDAEAIACFRRSVERFPRCAPAWSNIAASAYRLGDRALSEDAVARALAIQPLDHGAQLVRAWLSGSGAPPKP